MVGRVTWSIAALTVVVCIFATVMRWPSLVTGMVAASGASLAGLADAGARRLHVRAKPSAEPPYQGWPRYRRLTPGHWITEGLLFIAIAGTSLITFFVLAIMVDPLAWWFFLIVLGGTGAVEWSVHRNAMR